MSALAASAEELECWRSGVADDPGSPQQWLHLNAAGASPTPDAAHATFVAYLELERRVGGYEAASQRNGSAAARDAIAELLGCDEDEVALCLSAQAAWTSALNTLGLGSRDRVLFATSSEYAGNVVAALQLCGRTGASLEVVPSSACGAVDLAALETALAEQGASNTTLVCLCHINSGCSDVQDAAAVGALVRTAAAKAATAAVVGRGGGRRFAYLLDACQSFGQLPVDVRAIGADYACGTGRKWLRGPRGTGFLYARRDSEAAAAEPPLLDHSGASWAGGDSRTYRMDCTARRFELWERSEAAFASLAVAVRFALDVGLGRIHTRSAALAAAMREGLSCVEGVELRCGGACAIVVFDVAGCGWGAAELKEALRQRRIAVSVTPSTHSFDEEFRRRGPAVRASPHYFNTEGEVRRFVEAVQEIVVSRPPGLPGGGGGS